MRPRPKPSAASNMFRFRVSSFEFAPAVTRNPKLQTRNFSMFRASIRRLLAIDDPPERTALAFSIGVFITFSPILGLHTVIATLLAFLFRFNKVAIYVGTYINNPFTLVPIIIVSYGIGAFILGRPLRIPPE